VTAALATTQCPRAGISFSQRQDLRTGLTAAMRAVGPAQDQSALSFAETVREAVALWKLCRGAAPLALRPPIDCLADAAALDDMLRAAGAEPARTILELDETAMYGADHGLESARRLRARRWSLALRTDAAAQLALDHRDRALFGEFLINVSGGLPAFAGLFLVDRTPLSLRLQAAKSAGAAITAVGIEGHLNRRRAFQIGFDRGEAEPGLAAGRNL
jgi:hypothetical protein